MAANDLKFHDELDKSRVSHEKIATFYDEWAESYDEIIESSSTHINNIASNTLYKYYESKENIQILDVPCGSGVTGKALHDTGFRVIDGYDISQGMIDVAKEKKLYRHLGQGCISEKESLSCANNSYDGLICVQGITKGHIELKDALKEFIRVLKPNGIMVYTVNMVFTIDYIMELHKQYFLDGKLELVSLEKRFYYEKRGEKLDCYFCVMKKL